jgi:hypothetical protein
MDHTVITPRQAVENYHFPADAHLADPASGLLYCAIPKSGCSTGKRWFLTVAEPEILAVPQPPDIHARCRERWALCLTEDPIERTRLTYSALAFAIVRDPLERIASAFTEKFTMVYRDDLFLPAKELAERFEADRADGTTGVSFSEFVEHIAAAPDDALDSHWRPQSSFLRIRNDYLIAPIERLADTLKLIAGAIGRAAHGPAAINCTPYTEIPAAEPPEVVSTRLSSDLHVADLRPRAEHLYTKRLRELVQTRFRADIELHRRAMETWSESGIRRAIRRFLPAHHARQAISAYSASPTM